MGKNHKMHLKYVTRCRLCGSDKLEEILDLGGDHYLHGNFCYPGKQLPPTRKIPTKILRCCPDKDEDACGLVQRAVSVPPEILYHEYGYRSSTTSKMTCHLENLADSISKLLEGKDNPSILDIAANDFTLLKSVCPSIKRVGIDPSSAIDNVKAENNLIPIKDFFPSPKLRDENFDCISCIAQFYDNENPSHFMSEVANLLKEDGFAVFEFGYLPIVLENLSWDFWCDEHVNLYSLATFNRVLENNNLKLFDVILNDVNSGSAQCWIAHKNYNGWDTDEGKARIKNLQFKEFDLALDTSKPYYDFSVKVSKCYNYVREYLGKLRNEGKVVSLLGASTKSNLILQTLGLTNKEIPFISDRSEFKWGAKTLGTNIPIISEEQSRAKNPDYYLAFIYFKEELLKREQDYLNSGGRIIFILPKFEVWGKDGLEFTHEY